MVNGMSWKTTDAGKRALQQIIGLQAPEDARADVLIELREVEKKRDQIYDQFHAFHATWSHLIPAEHRNLSMEDLDCLVLQPLVHLTSLARQLDEFEQIAADFKTFLIES